MIEVHKQKLVEGDYIGFAILADGVDDNDSFVWCAVDKVVEVDGLRAYHYTFPDGSRSKAPIREMQLKSVAIRRCKRGRAADAGDKGFGLNFSRNSATLLK